MTDDDARHLEPFPLPEQRDTDKSELSPDEDREMNEHEAAKEVRKKQLETLDAHALLVSLHLRLDEIDSWRAKTDRRLEEGDQEFQEQKRDIGIVSSAVKALCAVRGLDDKVEELGRRLSDRFPSNGAAEHDVPTNPANERPDAE